MTQSLDKQEYAIAGATCSTPAKKKKTAVSENSAKNSWATKNKASAEESTTKAHLVIAILNADHSAAKQHAATQKTASLNLEKK